MGDADFPDDDDDELELEPVDPEVLAHERARAQAKTDEAIRRVKFDDIYEEPDDDPLIDRQAVQQFRFQTKHLLMLTAVLAVVLALFQSVDHACTAISILAVVLLAGGWGYVWRRERMLRARKERMRAEFEAGRAPVDAPLSALPEEIRPLEPQFRFAFSTQQLLFTVTGAAVAMGLLTLVSDKAVVAMLLGFIAILGLVIHAIGIELPPIVVLAWWLLLAFYLLLGLWIALFGDGQDGAAQRQAPVRPPSAWTAAAQPGVPPA